MTPAPRTLFIDAGGVLVRPNWSRVCGYFATYGGVADPARLARAELVAARELDTPENFRNSDDDSRWSRFVATVFRHAGLDGDAAVSAAVLRDMRAYHQSQNLWETVPPGVPEAVDRLHGAGFQLVVVSNANGTVRAKLERLGLAPRFHHILDSFEENVEKPDPRFFEILVARAGGRPETTLHVGDLYHVDVLGSRRAGLQSMLLDPHDLYAGYDVKRVKSLDQLVTAITGL